ncbi:Tad domain-containing protein [Sphingomonas sp. H160509]|uniref:Tad domain-containing protein n=1 Tax=Sphingomonas sp. H160509 TaxID=2955313 RepID=UPI0021E92462|nr:Tad domain-containing protein [Sphingomonas sp. H160509]MDD1450558.1 Tad domain-containing protein [Sphingomonas sp. H160509]
MCAIAGSAIDMARLYVVKSRMQQACDAGVLAGRKFMTDGNDATLDKTASDQAKVFFNNNLRSGWMGTKSISFVPTKTSENRVAGTAKVLVPMTIMKMFAAPDITLNVACEARYDVADTDILFVLDTTGSMACLPADSDSVCNAYVSSMLNNNQIRSYKRPAQVSADSLLRLFGAPRPDQRLCWHDGIRRSGKNGSRIAALRQAVVDFYKTMDANVQATTHVRYGFVTYSSSANVGAAIQAKSSSYMLGGSGAGSTWSYQSRKVTNDFNDGNPVLTYDNRTSQNCPSTTVRTPAGTTNTPYAYNTGTQRASIATQYWDSGARRCTTSTQRVGAVWTYKQWPWDVTSYVAGAAAPRPHRNQRRNIVVARLHRRTGNDREGDDVRHRRSPGGSGSGSGSEQRRHALAPSLAGRRI